MSVEHLEPQWVALLPWLLTIGLPLLLTGGIVSSRLRSMAVWLSPWAAVPAVGFAVWQPESTVVIPWLVLGTRLGIDPIARVFLLFTAVLWVSAGIYARAYLRGDEAQPRFFAFFLVTMSGNFGLILAQDLVSFYLFFALMSFAAYGLVVHEGNLEAHYAGRIYLILVIIGEVLLVSAFLLLVPSTGNATLSNTTAQIAVAPRRDLIIGLLLAGFGIKAGALPLHVWLPLAHPVAPTPASAVLSGAMIKAGLLGWLRFLPLGEVMAPEWGNVCISMGIAAAFFGVGVGLTQDNPKTVLAYSSISQMGFMTVALGIGLAVPTAWPSALTAVLLYSLHHGLAKGALFLGVGVAKGANTIPWQRRLVFVGLLVPALALAGVPLTSGAVAKYALKTAAALAPAPWPEWLGLLLPVAAVGTTLLVGRFLVLCVSPSPESQSSLPLGLWLPWAALLISVVTLIWFFVPEDALTIMLKTLSFAAVWPALIGAFVAWGVWRWQQIALRKIRFHLPAGDLLVGAERLVACGKQWMTVFHSRGGASRLQGGKTSRRPGLSLTALLQIEARLQDWAFAGVVFLLIFGFLLATLVWR
jgi:formate hydrogenlyase subunit 3/multisubunit Na+/H+ antiporter MnhD subunit